MIFTLIYILCENLTRYLYRFDSVCMRRFQRMVPEDLSHSKFVIIGLSRALSLQVHIEAEKEVKLEEWKAP